MRSTFHVQEGSQLLSERLGRNRNVEMMLTFSTIVVYLKQLLS